MQRLKSWLVKWLRKAEGITGTDNVYIAKNGGIVVLTYAINVLNGFVLYLLIGHYLPKEVYGQYKYYLSFFGLFSIATLTGIDTALNRAVARGYEGDLRVAFRAKLFAGYLGSVVALLGSLYYVLHNDFSIAFALVLIAIFAPFVYAMNIHGAFFSGKKQFGTQGKISVVSGGIYFIGMALATIFLRNSLWIFLVFLLVSLNNVIGYLYAKRQVTNDQTDKDLLSLGMHFSLVDALAVFASRIDSIVIFHFLGPVQLALYSLATIPVEQIKGFLKSLQTISLPKFATNNLHAFRATATHRLCLLVLGISGLMGIYALCAPMFFRVFFPQYLSSIPYSQWYGISVIFAVPAGILFALFQAKGMKKEVAWINGVSYTAQIIFLIIGCWLYGLLGAIFARIVTRAIVFASSVFFLFKKTDQ